jgi:hypothetical protein
MHIVQLLKGTVWNQSALLSPSVSMLWHPPPKCAFGISSPPFESAPAPDHRVAHTSPYCRCGIDTVVMRDFSLRSRDWVPRRLNSGTGLGCVVTGWAAPRMRREWLSAYRSS